MWKWGAGRRRAFAVMLAIAVVWTMSLPAAARPTEESTDAPPGLADFDGDRISDGLAASLPDLGPGQRVDVVVTWSQPPDMAAAFQAAGQFEVKAEFAVVHGFAASVNAGQIRALSRIPGVFRIEEDFQVQLVNNEANADFGTAQARGDFGVDGSGVVFCVVDTGVDVNHEQLDAGKVVAWLDAINGQPNPYDDQGHGTHVASTLGGDGVGGPNASLYRGVAPGVSIAAAKVLNSAGSGTESQVIQGIDFCISQQVDGISMSLGTSSGSDGNDGLSQAVDRAVLDHGIPSVVAAGNSGDGPNTVGAPGAARYAITVGAAAKVTDGLRLAWFSSRGPTLDGRRKPDVVSPGVDITAAQYNTSSGYVAHSGTSMATPFTAGVVALMLDCNSALTASQIKTILGSTATDLGVAGPDNNWGEGLIDGYQAVASVCGGSGEMALPTHEQVQGTVPNNGTYTHTFTVEADGVGEPITGTILIQGQMVCSFELFPGFCLIWEWSPDLDARLVGPGNTVLWTSECPLAGECGTVGQAEVVKATANQTGEYRIEVYAFTGSPNNGLGGGFVLDLFYGPVGGAPPPPGNEPPVAGDDAYTTSEDTPLAVGAPGLLGNDSDLNGDPLTASLVNGPTKGSLTLNGDGSFAYTPNPNLNGSDSFSYRASDGNGGSDQATVTITINPVNDPPSANAGSDQTVTDANGNGSESVTLNGTGSSDPDGDVLTYAWSEGSVELATGANPTVTLGVGSHTIALTVIDGSVSDTDTVVVTVVPPPPAPTMHVGDLDGVGTLRNSGRWSAGVTVAVHSSTHSLVSGATVSFSLSDGTTRSCTTGSEGRCSVSSKLQRLSTVNLTFTVLGVTHSSLAYESASNHDPDGDSNGTSITVLRPVT